MSRGLWLLGHAGSGRLPGAWLGLWRARAAPSRTARGDPGWGSTEASLGLWGHRARSQFWRPAKGAAAGGLSEAGKVGRDRSRELAIS